MVCIKRCHSFIFAVMDMQDTIEDAMKKADDVYRYIDGNGNSWDHVLFDLNECDARLDEARKVNEALRREANDRKKMSYGQARKQRKAV